MIAAMTPEPRSGHARVADTLAKLAEVEADTWVATASTDGVQHLVPLSYAWDGRSVILAAPASSVTVRNVRASSRARIGIGPTRDVVLADVEVDRIVDAADAPADLAERYAVQSGWDPRREPEPYVYVLLRLRRVQAWREANELEGKLIMRDGAWLY